MQGENKCWKWGVFYYNKYDNRILPPKKNPAFCWTVNFANPKSIVAFVIILAYFGLIYFMIESRK